MDAKLKSVQVMPVFVLINDDGDIVGEYPVTEQDGRPLTIMGANWKSWVLDVEDLKEKLLAQVTPADRHLTSVPNLPEE